MLDVLIWFFHIERQDKAGRVVFAIFVEGGRNGEDFYLLEAARNGTLCDTFIVLIAYLNLLWLKANTDSLLVIDTPNGRHFEYISLPPF